MKKIINLLSSSFIALFMIFMLVSCNTNTTPEHTHEFGNTYVSNSNSHWKECSCGEKENQSNHTYGEWIIVKEATEDAAGSKI